MSYLQAKAGIATAYLGNRRNVRIAPQGIFSAMTILERRIAILNTPHALMVGHTFDKPKRWTEVQHHAVTVLNQ
jgi:hypothetical protein